MFPKVKEKVKIEAAHINNVSKQPNPEKFYWSPTKLGFAPNASKSLKKDEKKLMNFWPNFFLRFWTKFGILILENLP